jgi:hypothetical protein
MHCTLSNRSQLPVLSESAWLGEAVYRRNFLNLEDDEYTVQVKEGGCVAFKGHVWLLEPTRCGVQTLYS